MSPLPLFNRHPRGDLSAYADGSLAPSRRESVASHLSVCDSCRAEADGLLGVRAALQGLPQAAPPRSFTLTPAMAAGSGEKPRARALPAFAAMRVASAGFAAVFAVVVLLDAGGVVDDAGRSSEETTGLGFLGLGDDPDAQYGIGGEPLGAEDDFAVPEGDDSGEAAPPGDGSAPASGDTPPADSGNDTDSGGGGVGGGADPAAPGATNAPGGGATRDENQGPITGDGEAPAGASDAPDKAVGDASADGEEPAAGPGDALSGEDGGVSSLLVVEIGLAALAVLAIAGSFALRRRAEAD